MAEIKISPKGLNSIFQQKELANFKIDWKYLVLTTNEKKNEQILSVTCEMPQRVPTFAQLVSQKKGGKKEVGKIFEE